MRNGDPQARRPAWPRRGDLLVVYSSGSGRGGRRGRRIPFLEKNARHLPGATHFDLLNHPEVHKQLRTWLA